MSDTTSPYRIHVDHAVRTIVITGIGSATTADTLELIRSAEPIFSENEGYNVIYDSTGLSIESSAADMVSVANALFAGSAGPTARFGVVVPERRAQLGMMFTALAKNHGIDACVFTQLADAWRWLGSEE
jgi:hypothetical protein